MNRINPIKSFWTSAGIAVLLACSLAACTSDNNLDTKMSAAKNTTASLKVTSADTVTSTTHKPTVPLRDIRMLDRTRGWALTEHTVLKTEDGGQHWQDITPATNNPLDLTSAADFMDAEHVWIATKTSGTTFNILRTTDGGANWQNTTIETSDAEGILDRPKFVSTDDGWLEVGAAQGMHHTTADLFHTTDGGQHWSQIASTDRENTSGLPAGGNKTGISFKDMQTGWVTAELPSPQAWLYKTADGGQSWQSQPLPAPREGGDMSDTITTPPVFFGNDGLLPVYIYRSQSGIDLYVTHDGGKTWTPTTLTTFGNRGSLSKNVYVLDMHHAWATSSTAFYTTSNGGQDWKKLAATPQEIGALSFVDSTHGWAIGSNNTPLLLQTADGGKTWQQINYSIQ